MAIDPGRIAPDDRNDWGMAPRLAEKDGGLAYPSEFLGDGLPEADCSKEGQVDE